jgi:hypothetical protein
LFRPSVGATGKEGLQVCIWCSTICKAKHSKTSEANGSTQPNNVIGIVPILEALKVDYCSTVGCGEDQLIEAFLYN